MSERFLVEVVFADKDSQHLKEVSVPIDTTVANAIDASGLREEFPNYDFSELKVGVWGEVVQLDRTVSAGDRIEIYRDLEVDPMEARRIRASAPDPDPCGSH